MSELVKIEEKNALELFSQEDGLKPVLDEIKKEVESFEPDLTTDKGRKEIASLANKVARSKTYLDGLGKDLVSGWKNKAKVVDAERRKVREFLDDLKAQARKPLTDFEEAEKARVKSIMDKIDSIKRFQDTEKGFFSLDQLIAMKEDLNNIDYSELDQVWTDKAEKEKEKSGIYLDGLIASEKSRVEAEQKAEAERKAAEEKARIEREEAIKKEAAAEAERKAKEAEQRAKEAEQRAKQAEEDAKRQEAERAEREKQAKIEAEQRAKEAAEKARNEEIERQKAAQKAAEEEQRKREANKRHIGQVRKAAKESLMSACGLDEDAAKAVVMAINSGSIENVTINY